MLADVKKVLTFAAFKPEPDDRLATWARRFPRERTLLLNVGRGLTTWSGLDRKGRLVDGGSQSGEFKEVAATASPEWRAFAEDGWCAVSLNTRYVISLETNVSRKPGVEQMLRTNPRAVLGGRYERGKRYEILNNPESIATILLSVEEEHIKQLESTLRDAGLKVGRITCGSFAMLRRLLETVHKTDSTNGKEEEAERQAAVLYVVCCDGSVCAMLEHGDSWNELRSRSDLYDEADYEPIFTILQPLISRLGARSKIHFVCDHAASAILDNLRKHVADAEIIDHGRDDYLWHLLSDRR
ncbi:MAG: hypothetical protein WA771_14545 [Chthoniobacterales bacterium]